MACYSPLPGFVGPVNENGKRPIVWKRSQSPTQERCPVPCGKCVGCRLAYSKDMAVRCMHEAQMHNENCFLTLTYDDAHLPPFGELNKRDHQLFLKRLRKAFPDKKIRYFMAGEYGGRMGRPHYHYLLFGHNFSDLVLNVERFGHKVYESKSLRELWPFGVHTIGEVTFQSAAYVARYCVKKVNDACDYFVDENGQRIQVDKKTGQYKLAEFTLMSRGRRESGFRGIGSPWYASYKGDVFPSDEVIVNGRSVKPPRYYDNLLAENDSDLLDSLKLARAEKVKWSESTMDRLLVKEQVALAKLKHLVRPLEVL